MSDCRSNCPILEGGLCPRHHIHKTVQWVQLCIRKKKYWDAWEKGAGPGQMNRGRLSIPTVNSHIGDILAKRFESIGLMPVPGCPCKELQNRLNNMTPEAVMSDLPGLSVKLRNSAKK